MKNFINTLTHTYKAVRLLSNPAFSQALEQTLATEMNRGTGLGKGSVYFHRHYTVEVTN